jgi:hypothetical protein
MSEEPSCSHGEIYNRTMQTAPLDSYQVGRDILTGSHWSTNMEDSLTIRVINCDIRISKISQTFDPNHQKAGQIKYISNV